MRLSDQQLETIRTRPQRSRLNLFIFTPRPVLKARLNANIDKGTRNIPYLFVTGSYASIEPDMTLLVGSTDGAEDYGGGLGGGVAAGGACGAGSAVYLLVFELRQHRVSGDHGGVGGGGTPVGGRGCACGDGV